MITKVGNGEIDIPCHVSLTITHNFFLKTGDTPFDYLMYAGSNGIWESDEDRKKALDTANIWHVNVMLPMHEKSFFGTTLNKAMGLWQQGK